MRQTYPAGDVTVENLFLPVPEMRPTLRGVEKSLAEDDSTNTAGAL